MVRPLQFVAFAGIACVTLIGLAVCAKKATNDSSTLDIYWSVELEDKARQDALGHPELRMRVPREYVTGVIADSEESRRLSHVNSRGVHTLELEALLPDFKAVAKPAPESANQRVYIMLEASYRFGDGTFAAEHMRHQARRQMAYRLPDLYGLERFRRIGCPFYPKDDNAEALPRDTPPTGCHESDGDENLFGVDDGNRVWITCAKTEGGCAMRTAMLRQWNYVLIFRRQKLESWRQLRKSSELFLTGLTVK